MHGDRDAVSVCGRAAVAHIFHVEGRLSFTGTGFTMVLVVSLSLQKKMNFNNPGQILRSKKIRVFDIFRVALIASGFFILSFPPSCAHHWLLLKQHGDP
jgi:hypothetical protein